MRTKLLPPITAIHIVWSRTGEFSDEAQSKKIALVSKAQLEEIRRKAVQEDVPAEERAYVGRALALIESSMRTLDTVYKARSLNFKENGKLRDAYLNTVKSAVQQGKSLTEYVMSLPGLAIGSAGGVTLATVLTHNSTLQWAAGVFAAALGYLINWWFLWEFGRRKERNYVLADYQRNLYFEQYVERVEAALGCLHAELERAHLAEFGESYENQEETRSEIACILDSIRPTWCKYIHEHIHHHLITAIVWPMCETGGPEKAEGKTCPNWPS